MLASWGIEDREDGRVDNPQLLQQRGQSVDGIGPTHCSKRDKNPGKPSSSC